MEIKIYASLECRRHGKTLYCSRVSDPDSFSYQSCIDVFRSLYGRDIVIEFLVV